MGGSDVIVIGAGMAGLSAGCYAQMNGYRSHVFESHVLPGGLCTAWKRKGYVFDTSIHMLMSSRSGMFHPMWQELGVVQGRTFVDRDVLMRVETMGRTVDVHGDLDRLEHDLLALAPAAEDARLVRELIRLSRLFVDFELDVDKPSELRNPLERLRHLRRMVPPLAVLRRANWTLAGFAGQFRDPRLAAVVQRLFDNSGWPMPDAPLITALVSLAAYHTRNAGTPLGGSIGVAQTVARRYRALGGTLHFSSRVERILVEGGRAVGVRLADGTEHRAGAVVSAADGRATLFGMLEGRFLSPQLRRVYAEWKVYPPLIQVMLGVARDFSSEPGHLLFDLPRPVLIAGQSRSDLDVHHYCHDPSMAPPGKSVVQVWLTSNFDYWATLHQDAKAYEAEKQRVAELAIAELDRRWPGLAGQVEVVDVATPWTFAKYTGNWRGSPDGWCITPQNMGRELPQRLPGLERFFMAGQWTVPFSGVPFAAMSGRHAVQLLCHDDGRTFQSSTPSAFEPVTGPEFHDDLPPRLESSG